MIIKEYIQNYESLSELQRRFNCNVKTIKTVIIDAGYRIRTRSEQNRYTNMKRAKKCNDSYFSNIDTYNKAWLIGFLAADGTVRKEVNTIKIGLSARDKEILEKIKEEVAIERTIKEYTSQNGFDIVELEWSSYQQKQDLAKYGVVPNKTYLENHLPTFENEKYTLAYILGYFDGDGSISVSKDGYLRFRLCCYREEFLKDVKKFFEEEYQASCSLSKASNRQMYELSISTTYAKQIFKDMYALNSLHLDRKYQKYLEYISQETLTSRRDEKVR
jgi:hypothetical protein